MKIPRMTDDRVDEQMLPNAQFRVDAGDFGQRNIQQMQGATEGMIGAVEKIVIQEQKEADQVVQLEAGTRAAQKEMEWNDRIRNAQGKDSFSLHEQFDEDWKKFESDIDQGLIKNDRQRAMVSRMMLNNRSELQNRIATHQFAEKEKYFVDQSKAFIETDRSASIDSMDPMRIAESIGKQKAVVEQMGVKFGWSPEKLKLEQDAVEQKTHIDTVNVLKNSNPEGALAYYDEHKIEIGASLKRETLVKDIKDLEKAKEYEREAAVAKNELGIVTSMAQGNKPPTPVDVVQMAALGRVRPEFAQAYTTYITDPENFYEKEDAKGFYNTMKGILSAKNQTGINDVLMDALNGGKDRKIAFDDLKRAIAAANEIGDVRHKETMDAMFKSIDDWAATASLDENDKGLLTGEWIDQMIAKTDLTDVEKLDDAKKSFLKKKYPEVSQYENVPTYIATKEDGLKLLFNKFTDEDFDFVYDPKTKKSVPSDKQKAENRKNSK